MEAVFKKFEGLYRKGEYQKAEKLLLTNKEEIPPGIFHYNLGTIHLKIENFSAARFHLEKLAPVNLI